MQSPMLTLISSLCCCCHHPSHSPPAACLLPAAGEFFTYLLLMFCVLLCMSALFRLVGCIAATQVHAQGYAATTILILVITSGFAIVRSECPGVWG